MDRGAAERGRRHRVVRYTVSADPAAARAVMTGAVTLAPMCLSRMWSDMAAAGASSRRRYGRPMPKAEGGSRAQSGERSERTLDAPGSRRQRALALGNALGGAGVDLGVDLRAAEHAGVGGAGPRERTGASLRSRARCSGPGRIRRTGGESRSRSARRWRASRAARPAAIAPVGARLMPLTSSPKASPPRRSRANFASNWGVGSPKQAMGGPSR